MVKLKKHTHTHIQQRDYVSKEKASKQRKQLAEIRKNSSK